MRNQVERKEITDQIEREKIYRIQNGCHNCKQIFIKYEYDSRDYFYCVKDAPKRPLCMSVAMNESPEYPTENDWKEWDKWTETRNVKSYGICDNWKEK